MDGIIIIIMKIVPDTVKNSLLNIDVNWFNFSSEMYICWTECCFVQGSLVASLMGILQLMREPHYTKLWDAHMNSGIHHLRHLLHSTIILLADLVRAAVFPSDWFVMRMVTNYTILVAMQEIAQPLIATFLKQGRFDNQVSLSSYDVFHSQYLYAQNI